jgi:hypothetical protein
MKEEYVAPVVEELGSLRELTLGQSYGTLTDADFPRGTPFGDVTFS